MCTNLPNGKIAINKVAFRKCNLGIKGKEVTYCGAGWKVAKETTQGVTV